jgi:S1-C subfamily serine protease
MGVMSKRKILVITLLAVFVIGACRVSFSAPDILQDITPRLRGDPTQEVEPPLIVTVSTPDSSIIPLPDLPPLDLDLADRDTLLTELYKRVSPGVVSILVEFAEGVSAGSGFVFDKDGHIVTNYHVVEGADQVEVDFPSGYKGRGEVIGTDLDSDLAVIKVAAPEEVLLPLLIGNSDDVNVGQTVIAIGNPFGLSGTMTIGIVSAKGRTLESLRQTEGGSFFTAGDIIQTDAAINPGNSGGPLINLNGEVVGVNRAIRTTGATVTGDPLNSGIGFAISSNIVLRVVPALIEDGAYDYPYLGVTSREDLTLDMIEELGLARQTGAYITSVTPGGPADMAGLQGGNQPTSFPGLAKGGDLIIAIDGKPVMSFGEMLSYLINNKGPGDQVKLIVLRDGEEKEVALTLGRRP